MALSLAVYVGFVLTLIFCYLIRRQWGIEVGRVKLRKPSSVQNKRTTRRTSAGNKEKLQDSSSTDYADILPPSRGSALVAIREQLPSSHPLCLRPRTAILEGPGQTKVKRFPVPLETPSHELQGHEVTPTGIAVEEIRLLGDFPDYATLSGIPLPNEYCGFDIKRALSRPYRPFRWAYHQTMSISKLEPDWWIELEREYSDKITQRKALYAEHGPLVLQHLPGSEMACKELMEMVVQFLCARYPRYFSLLSDDASEAGVKVLENRILGVKTRLDRSVHPLNVLLEHVPEDFAVMIREPETGLYHLRAGVICSALGWSLGTKIGQKLHEVHGPVPEYAAKMRFSMDRYFAKKPAERGIQRGSWGFEVDRPLFIPPGDPQEAHRLSQEPGLALHRVHLRVDWQTLRRLPLTGAVAFNFKGLFTPLAEFQDEPYVPALTLKVLRDGNKEITEYKNTWHVEHVVVPALAAWAREQEEQGVTEKGWKVQTLDESPFFPNWEKKWRGQQGF